MALPGTSHYPHVFYEDMHITEKQKTSVEYLKGNIDHWIATLVHTKNHIKGYRDYYNGVRNAKDFEYLTDNFGIGTPATLKFTNLIKARVDSLVAQLESDTHQYTVSCTDDKTIDLIQEQKKKGKLDTIMTAVNSFTKFMESSIATNQEVPKFSELKWHIEKSTSKYNTNFLSDFEIAAQRVCTYFEKSNHMKIKHKLALLVHDLIVTGECYWRATHSRLGSDPELEVLKPENTFHNKSTDSPFINGTDAVVYRKYLTHKEVAAKYGKFMDAEQISSLFGEKYGTTTSRSLMSGADLETYEGEESPLRGERHYSSAHTVEVVHVEWLATNSVEYTEEDIEKETTVKDGKWNIPNKDARRQDLYEGTRIGGSFYVNCGKVENVARSQNNPNECTFTYGGLVNNDRNGKPYSIVGALKDVQDIYDLTMFYRDNLVANSGVQGDRINVAGIPKVLGSDFMDRLFKFIALKKNGLELIDPTEPGAQLFNHHGGFDNTVNGQSLMAIESLLKSVEHQADVIAGTTPQMLGHIQERDAVSNVQVGLKQSLAANQSLFELFRSGHNDIMASLLGQAQISYKSGKKISYIAGADAYTYTILPEHFCFTDYAISVSYASKDAHKLNDLKLFAKEMITAGAVDPDVMTKVILSDSITEVSRLITENWQLKKLEAKQNGAEQQLEQMQNYIKELEAKISNAEQQLQASKDSDKNIKAAELELKQKELKEKMSLEERKRLDNKEYNEDITGLKRETVQLEREQLYLGTGSSKEIKNL